MENPEQQNKAYPSKCPECGSQLESSLSYGTSDIAYCPNEKCEKGIVYETYPYGLE